MNGLRVLIKFSDSAPYSVKEATLENITEIHAGYDSVLGKRIAFESDIDRTGYTYDIADIAEYEATIA